MSIEKALPLTILQLAIDGIFKMYFEDPGNLPELKSLLKAYLELSDDDLSTIQILNPGLSKDNFDDKGFSVDLLLEIKNGDALHIEMQTGKHKNFKERIQLYNARKAAQQIKVGEKYQELKRIRRTISLIITTFPVFKKDGIFQERIVMRRENGEVFTVVQELNIIDLTKASREATQNKEKYLWAKLLQVTTMEELKMIANESKEISEAAEKLLQISADKRAQAYVLSYENAIFARALYEQDFQDEIAEQKANIEDQETEIKEQRVELDQQFEEVQKQFEKIKKQRDELNKQKNEINRQKETMAKEKNEAKITIAKSLLESGMSIEAVTKHSNLPIEVIKSLK